MRLSRCCCLSLIAVIFAGTPAVAQNRLGSPIPREATLNDYGLTKAWWSQATTNAQRDRILYLTADDKNVYAQSSSGVVSAFAAESGKRLWATQVGGVDRATFPAASNEEHLFVVNGMNLYAVRRMTGDITWTMKMPGQPTSSPVTDKNRVYLGFLDGSLYCFDVKKIEELNNDGLLPTWSYQGVMWRYKTSKKITSQAVPNGRLVAFASHDGSLYSVSAEQRELVFQFETNAALSAPIARHADNLLLASEDFNFYALNMENGRLAWQFSAGLPIRNAPLVIRDEIYLMPERAGMYKLSAIDGSRIWQNPRASNLVAVSPSRVYARDRLNNLLILSRADGSELGMMHMQRFEQHVLNVSNDRIYLATESGLVICLHELGRDYPATHVDPDTLPLLPELAPESTDDPAAEGAMPADGEAESGATTDSTDDAAADE